MSTSVMLDGGVMTSHDDVTPTEWRNDDWLFAAKTATNTSLFYVTRFQLTRAFPPIKIRSFSANLFNLVISAKRKR